MGDNLPAAGMGACLCMGACGRRRRTLPCSLPRPLDATWLTSFASWRLVTQRLCSDCFAAHDHAPSLPHPTHPNRSATHTVLLLLHPCSGWTSAAVASVMPVHLLLTLQASAVQPAQRYVKTPRRVLTYLCAGRAPAPALLLSSSRCPLFPIVLYLLFPLLFSTFCYILAVRW